MGVAKLHSRRWRQFKANKRGYFSLIIFTIIFLISLAAELVCNDKPFLVYYEGSLYAPILKMYPETTFGGDFETEADYRDPYILEKINSGENKAFFPINPHSYGSINLTRPLAEDFFDRAPAISRRVDEELLPKWLAQRKLNLVG